MKVFLNEYEYNDQLISICNKKRLDLKKINELNSIKNVFDYLKHYKNYIDFKYNSNLFKNLKDKLDSLNWVDVENEYFEELLKSKRVNNKFDYEIVKKLNNDFYYLKILLEKYLIRVVKNSERTINPNRFTRIFEDYIYKDEIVLKKIDVNLLPEKIHVLNFNYTSTVESSVKNNIPTDINYIHGMLDFDENPIIFGFGDEFDINYKEFEKEKNNILFEHIKSFRYFRTPNYHNLIRFIESDDYQVYIIGHSCGLSDRTMLKEIFENEKCKSVKIFYYEKLDQENDYVEKTMEISRHFEDKGLMRKKIVPFHLSKKM